MPSPQPPRHALRAPVSPRGLRRPHRAAVAALAVGLALVGVAMPALAAPITPAYPTVFISQVISNSVTTMRSVEQSRLAGAGKGGVTITSLAPNGTAAFAYNAVSFRPTDNYLYGVASDAQLVRIEHDGTATKLGAIRTPANVALSTAMYSGAFGTDPNILFARPTGASSTLYLIDVTTLRYTTRTLSQSVSTNDFSFLGGYLWGVDASGPSKQLVRIEPTTGTVTTVDVNAIFPTADANNSGTGYGAAWTYGNGNLAFSYNTTGTITQIKVADLAAAVPQVQFVSSIAGPSTSQNDGATTPSTPTDLHLVVTNPAPSAPSSSISWTVDVVNAGPAGSSGATFSYPVPAGVTGVTLPTGCSLVQQSVQCVAGQLAVGGVESYSFTGVSPASPVVSATSTVTVTGNEADATDNTATLVVAPLPQALTTTGVGTAVQQVAIAVPTGGTLTLLDGTTPVTSLVVAGKGTYAVSGSTLTFSPALGFTGSAPAVPFQVTSGVERGTGTYTATVTLPAGPSAVDLTSSDVSPRSQTAGLTLPPSGSATLLDGGGAPASTVAVAGGSYTLAAGVVTFTPDALFVGTAPAVTYRVTDAYGQTDIATYTPTVTMPAGPAAVPLTSDGVGTAAQSPAAVVAVPAGGDATLLDGDGAPAATVTVPGQGTYGFDAATGELTFTPVLGFAGVATPVTYRVTDAYGQSDTATYTPTVYAPAAPTAPAPTTTGVGTTPQSTTLVAPTDGSVTLLDADGDPATTVTVPGEGTYTLVPATGVVTFVPVLGFQGPATPVTFRLTDAYGQTAPGTYTPTVTPPAAPVAADPTTTGPVVTDQDTTVTVPTGGQVRLLDADGDPVTTVVVPGVGTYVLDPSTGEIVFTPAAGFSGTTDGVDYVLTDAYGQTATGTYTPTVTPPAPPVAPPSTSDGIGTADQQTVVTVPADGSVTLLDADGDPATTVTVPGEGTYVLDPATGAVTFTPELGFQGETSGVDVRVTDGYGQSVGTTYTPTVRAPAPPAPADLTSQGTGTVPQAPATTVGVPAGGSVTLLDADGDPAATVTLPGQGTYTLDPATGALQFTPVLGFQGPATPVTVEVTDAYGQSATATYTPTVTAPAGPALTDVTTSGPAVTAQQVTVAVPGGGSVTLLDADGDPVTSVTVPGQGGYALDPATGVVTFTPVLGFSGPATPVTVRVTDAYGQTDTATYTPTVTPPAAPSAVPLTSDGVGTATQSPVAVVVVPSGGGATLLDGGGQPVTSVTVPGQGTYGFTSGTGVLTFAPVLGFAGVATPVTYRVTDAYGQSATATYTPTVYAPAAPTAPAPTTTGVGTTPQSTTLVAPTDGSVTLLDADGDPATTVTVPGEGTYTLAPATGVVTFVPVLGFQGPATPVAFQLTDAYGQTAPGTYTPTVTPPAAPVASDPTTTGPVVTDQQTTVTVPAGGQVRLLDADGDPATTVVVPLVGTYVLDPATGEIVFTPVAGFSGTTGGVDYVLTDAYGQTATGTYTPSVTTPTPPAPVDLTSQGAGTVPQAPATTVVVPAGGSVTLLDADGDPVMSVTVPGQGTYALDPATGALQFTPVLGFQGPVTPVTFQVTDGYGQSATATYAPVVTAPAGPVVADAATSGPAVTPQQLTVAVPGGGSVTLLDADGAPALQVDVAAGTYVLDPASGEVTFTPVLGFAGVATPVSVRVTDAYGQTDTATWTPTVVAPAGPAATSTTTTGVGTTPQSTALAVPVPGTVVLLDGAGDPATTVVVAGQGTYVLDPATGTVTFTAVHGFSGVATSVTFRVTDAYGQAATGTYTPTVQPPSGPVAADRSSTGPVVTPQQTVLTVPPGGAVTLLDAGFPATAVTVAGQGAYALDPTSGVVVFTPAAGFAGVAAPVTFRVTDVYGQAADGTYTPTVVPPAPPAATPAQSTGVGVQPQGSAVVVPDGGTVTLLDGAGQPATSVVVPGQGTYVLDPATGAVTFTPVLGYVGQATPVQVRVTDAYGQATTTTSTATVLAPAPPVAAPFTSTGTPGQRQTPQTRVTVPVGGSVTLLDANGREVSEVLSAGEGTYALDAATGTLSFVPVPGFTGVATPVAYRVTDAYGQVAQSTYRAEVLSAGAEPAAALARTGGAPVGLLLAGGALVLVGAFLLVVGRPRRR